MTQGAGVDEEWPAAGTLLALRYRLAERLATGGMAEIWRADDELLGRSVALKLPTPRAAEILHQAWTEARTTARLSHPHIAAVHDYGEAPRPDGSVAPFVVMELLDGESLAARLASGPLAWPDAARVGAEVAAGLAAAHDRHVVHRDIKPGNIMLTPTGTKILDFGISTVTGTPDDDETGATFGTPAYVAPERLDGKPAEPATDVYALGTVLFEMVSGEPPYPVDTWEEFAVARAAGPGHLPEGLPAGFRDVVDRCLAEDPAERPEAAEVRDRLTALRPPDEPPRPPSFAAGRATPSTVELPGRPIPKAVRVAVVVALLAAAGAAVALGAWNGDDGGTPGVAASPPPPLPTTGTATPPPPPPPTVTTTAATPPAQGLDEAVEAVTTAVEDGRAAGQIRDDVAVDLLNLLRQLDDAPQEDVGRRVDELRRKVRQRIDEDGLTRSQAAELDARLDAVART